MGNTKNHLCTSSVISRNGKVLLGLRNYTEGSFWIAPGGRCDDDESPETTVLREIQEEIGVSDASIIRLLGEKEGSYEDEAGKDRVLVFEITTSQEPQLMEPEKFSEWRWFSYDELPDNLLNPDVDRAFFAKALNQ